MEKIECCAVIQYVKSKGWNPKVFHKDMAETRGENAPSHTIVQGSRQNFKEEETAFKITCIVKDLQAPWTKKWLPETVTLASCGWPVTDFQAHSHYPFFTFWPKNWLWGKCQRDGSPHFWQMLRACRIQHLWQYVPIWRWSSWLTEQIFA